MSYLFLVGIHYLLSNHSHIFSFVVVFVYDFVLKNLFNDVLQGHNSYAFIRLTEDTIFLSYICIFINAFINNDCKVNPFFFETVEYLFTR